MEENEKPLEENVRDGPALYKKCVKMYQAMANESVSDGEYLTYEGFITRLVIDDLGLSNAYYSQMRSALVSMGCIEQLVRGGASTPSVWRLFKEPTFEDFDKASLTASTPKQQQIRDILNRLNIIEDRLDKLER